MALTRIRKSQRKLQEQDVESIDSCTKLLDQEISNRKTRRKSMPFFLPSRYASHESLPKNKKDLKKRMDENRMDETTSRNIKFKWLILHVWNLSSKSPSSNASSMKSVEQNQCPKQNETEWKQDKYQYEHKLSEKENEEFYTTWKRIQGSRICLNEEEQRLARKWN